MHRVHRADELLAKAADQFRFYQQQHEEKIPALERELSREKRIVEARIINSKLTETKAKAQLNDQMASEIEAFLSGPASAFDLAVDAIASELHYSDSLWPQSEHDNSPNPLRIGEFILLAGDYLDQARAAWCTTKEPEGSSIILDKVRKVAGIVTNCLRQHGAPWRYGFTPTGRNDA